MSAPLQYSLILPLGSLTAEGNSRGGTLTKRNHSRLDLSAPLQYSLILPLDSLTAEENSRGGILTKKNHFRLDLCQPAAKYQSTRWHFFFSGLKHAPGLLILDPSFLSTPEIEVTFSLQAGGNQLTNDRHPLPVAVEVQDGQDIVGPLDPHLTDGDGVLCSRQENVPEVPCGRHQRPLVRGSCLVIELTCRIAARTQLRVQLDTAGVHTENRDHNTPQSATRTSLTGSVLSLLPSMC